MKNLSLLILIALWAGFNSTTMKAQKTLHIVSKEVKKKLSCNAGSGISVDAEKSNIEIKGWDKNYVDLKMELISKHPKKEVAEQEVNYLKYDISEERGHHSIRNYFQNDDGFSTVKGSLSVKYFLKVPYSCPVDIIQSYGSLSVQDLDSDFQGNLKFVSGKIKNLSRNVTLDTKFGGVECIDIGGVFKAKLRKTNLTLSRLNGQVDIESRYGRIDIEDTNMDMLSLNGDKTKVSLFSNQPEKFNYHLSTTFADIKVPDSFGDVWEGKDSVHYKNINPANNALIRINTSYQPISIQVK
ncbi:MAG: hypothetical protein AAF363_11170 [Bacteroidota bacterium]